MCFAAGSFMLSFGSISLILRCAHALFSWKFWLSTYVVALVVQQNDH